MKKILFLIGMVLITNVANAQIEYYTSVKMGLGNTIIYVNDDTKLGDYLVKISELNTGLSGYKYSKSGSLWEAVAAIGIDCSWGQMYGKQNPYEWFHLRLEGELGYNDYHEKGELRLNYTVTDNIKIKYDNIFVLANGYADFKIDNIVPYIGFGVGYSLGKEEIHITNEHGVSSDSANDNGFIYAWHLGVGYKYSDITTFDLGARRIFVPTEGDGLDVFDTIRLGVRFRI